MFVLEVDIFGDLQIAREILRVSERSGHMQPAFEVLHRSFLGIERHQFNTQGGYSGGWPPVQAETLRRKLEHGGDARTLHDTLALRNSLTQKGASGHVVRITADQMFFGTSVKSDKGFPYPATHQNPKRGQVRRRPVELSQSHRRRWVKFLQRYLFEGKLTGAPND